MKRTILAITFGVAASLSPTYGQGYIFFNNYGTSTDAIVTTCPDYRTPAGPSFTAGLLYGFGTITDPSHLTLSGITQSFNPAVPGYFTGPIVQIPGYSGGPITFSVIAYDGPSPNSSYNWGASSLFTLPSIATGTQPVGEFGPGLRPFVAAALTCVPEPSTIALVGLGLVSLLIFRSRAL